MQKTRYYVSRKHPLTWICAILLLGAVFVRIAAVTFWKGEGVSSCNSMWFAVILPSAASVLYALQILTNLNQNFYRTAIPVWLACLCDVVLILSDSLALHLKLLYSAVYLAIAVAYTVVTAGKTKRDWSLVAIFGAGIAYYILCYVMKDGYALTTMHERLILGRVLELTGLILLVFAIKIHNDGKYHPTWGDRPDGRKLRSLDPITTIGVYIMPDRNGASNQITNVLDITEAEKYIRRKRAEGHKDFGMTDVLLAAYVRCVAQYPGINRFISGQKIFSRGDDIQFSMTVKKEMSIEGSESIIKLHLNPRDTADDIHKKLHAAIQEVKDTPLDSDFDNTARYLTFVPGVLLKFVVWVLKTMDYFGLLPKFLLEVSPFHASVFFTSMGSLGIPTIVHHLYDFGNMPVFCAFGTKRRVATTQEDGTVVIRRTMDYSFNLDERTVDGFYYAAVLKYFQRLLRHPEVLDEPPQNVVRDVD